jgi:hypothetical protein
MADDQIFHISPNNDWLTKAIHIIIKESQKYELVD